MGTRVGRLPSKSHPTSRLERGGTPDRTPHVLGSDMVESESSKDRRGGRRRTPGTTTPVPGLSQGVPRTRTQGWGSSVGGSFREPLPGPLFGPRNLTPGGREGESLPRHSGGPTNPTRSLCPRGPGHSRGDRVGRHVTSTPDTVGPVTHRVREVGGGRWGRSPRAPYVRAWLDLRLGFGLGGEWSPRTGGVPTDAEPLPGHVGFPGVAGNPSDSPPRVRRWIGTEAVSPGVSPTVHPVFDGGLGQKNKKTSPSRPEGSWGPFSQGPKET